MVPAFLPIVRLEQRQQNDDDDGRYA